MTAPLCFVDTETDGVHPGRRPWEVALIRRDYTARDSWRETVAHFFLEIDLSTADPFGLNVGRFYERHPMGTAIATRFNGDEKTPRAVSHDVLNPDGIATRRDAAVAVARMTHGAHLVGAVPSFDAHVFDRLLRDHGLAPSWHYHLIDVEALAVGYIHGRRSGGLIDDAGPGDQLAAPWNSEDLSRAVGVEPAAGDERHTALGDARWAMRLYDAVTRQP